MAEILILAEHDGETVKKVTTELVTLARRFGEPAVVWAGPGAEGAQARLAEFGAAKVYVAAGPEYDEYVAAPKAELLAALAQQKSPAAVLLPSTAEGREIGGRLAVKTGWGILTDVVGLARAQGLKARVAWGEETDVLDVDFLLKSDPTRVFRGKLHRDRISGEANPNKEDANDNEPFVVAYVDIEHPSIPKEYRVRRDQPTSGTEVRANTARPPPV